MQVKWLIRALQNLDDEAAYIAQENPQAASTLVSQVISSVNQLSNFPNLGRTGRVFGTRELVITGLPYIIPYRVKDEVVEILRVFHTSRKWPRSL
ncbi:MAG: type II toxin-antitoxin system RelE/ParE family toxin [Methylotenera sp.]|nr:type II toxin-antitoxin system RelE/ParE family toxin [Methylotenera sp.]